MPNRAKRAQIAKETLGIIERGFYSSGDKNVEIADSIRKSKEQTKLYRPIDCEQLFADRDALFAETDTTFQTEIVVENTTTLSAARRFKMEDASTRVMCLNFASAKNPGGGFLGGSQAQEESLARASALYECLVGQDEYYETNRAEKSCLYTDHLIYSKDVPVFRDDNDDLLSEPYCVTIITSPAPNAGAIRKNRATDDERKTLEVFKRRIEQVLSVAAIEGDTHLILGAWGCGVFGNDPNQVAKLFFDHLTGKFSNRFRNVTFAVLDRTKEQGLYSAFVKQFRSASTDTSSQGVDEYV